MNSRRLLGMSSSLIPWQLAATLPIVATWLWPAIVGSSFDTRAGPLDEACPECRIEVEHALTVGDPGGPGAIGDVTSVTQLGDGRIVLVSTDSEVTLSVFSGEGEFLQNVGRRGEGPGEFQFIRWVRASEDALHVFDPGLRRHTVFTSDLTLARTEAFAGDPLGDALPLSDSSFILNGAILTRELIGKLLHHLQPEQRVAASFDEPPGSFGLSGSPEVHLRALAPAQSSEEEFWSAHRTRYQIERWNSRGERIRTLRREVPWFPDHEGHGWRFDAGNPPLPQVMDVREDSENRLWLLMRVPSERWDEALEPGRDGRGSTVTDLDLAYDAIIEVLDADSGALITSRRVEPALFKFVGVDFAASTGHWENFSGKLELWQLSFVRPESR